MTYVAHNPAHTYLNDPSWWPFLIWIHSYSNSAVVSSVVVVYDWALTSGQEFELIWKQRWSLIKLLYIGVRYYGILYAIVSFLGNVPISNTDKVGGNFFYFLQAWTPVIVNSMLAIIMMTRIYAMYQQSKPILVFLALALVASTITSGAMLVMGNTGISGEEFVLSGYHICLVQIDTPQMNLNHEMVIPTAIWEILAFLLAVWVVILRFREMQQSRTGSSIGDCFTMLIKSHALYFLAFAAVACFNLGDLSPQLLHSTAMADDIYAGALRVARVLQMFVLGPRLILSIREYHFKLTARSDGETGITAIAFQALGQVSTDSDVELDTMRSNPV
ncbi:uncharacterized protein EDB93DRAFT_195700 [Suillus bovinus]|uniref:uncharacterized protein n=1 Tax=Suillus bovinus TaxID=48563 RepID=UPI001B86420D|nr:uncharacterized protein EDB93DRAFT_195700 [Suillus bovinus]KAG2127893.1 hypothetical protein EDB93DRAFT_195700 [Suillus bovinus]